MVLLPGPGIPGEDHTDASGGPFDGGEDGCSGGFVGSAAHDGCIETGHDGLEPLLVRSGGESYPGGIAPGDAAIEGLDRDQGQPGRV